MCGVAGFLALDGTIGRDQAQHRLGAMIGAIRHRGPDDQGVWTDGVCGLGHARLAIIDVTPAGHQPMATHDQKLWIVFNGEIYNFHETRAELESKGCAFKSRSDTEVILEGYRVWGDGVIDKLRGMFAFALWDPARQRLLMARDRIGKKPLFYTRIGNTFVFGSEMKALFAWPGLDRAIDRTAIDQYLTYQYIPAPRTAFASVKKLQAAHKLVIEKTAVGWRVGDPERYWRPPAPKARPAALYDERALAEELVHRLKESTRLRMISDVPLGAFLSGGVDSSAVVAMMAQLSDKPVKTFSIGFPHEEYDETRYARMVAERYGTDHEELILEPKAADILPRLIWHYNEPYADSSMIPTYYVSELARRHVTVALNGDGGDEAFMGYGRYDTMAKISKLDVVPPSLAPTLARAIRGAPKRRLSDRLQQRMGTWAYLLDERARKASQRYAFTIVYFMDQQKHEGYAPEMEGFLEGSALDLLDPYFNAAPSMVSGADWADVHTYLPDDLMVKVDIASMSVSLESRSPLLDHELMEWALGLPESVKRPGGVAKGLFKKAMEPHLPHDLLYRPKMGFGCPIDHWLRSDLREMAHDVLLSDRAESRGIMKREYVAKMLREHMSGETRHDTRLFALLSLELWFRMWVDQSPDAALERPPIGMTAAAAAA